jgi:hypothetical protein
MGYKYISIDNKDTKPEEKEMRPVERVKRTEYDAANTGSVAIFKPRVQGPTAGSMLVSNIAFQAPITINIGPRSAIPPAAEPSESKSVIEDQTNVDVPFSLCNPSTWCR